ncbi:hypothetical protein GEV33_003651 [Tenebrio molitor]|uniref:DUF5641 domain-containing protein n=1 Tax=Tenebrio molitor TaxID=7067 RepID=A0A8J6LF61_TENMO|nr:hypothetical protein GEV33_003651 [Tenebrio molitor]
MDNPKTSRSTAKDEILKDLDKAQLRVEMMPGNVLTDEENDNERNSFERRYCDVASKILSLIQKIQNEEQEIIAGTNVRSRSESNSIDDNKTSVFHFSQQKLDLHEQVDQVVTIESVISVEDELSPKERERKTHFFDTIKRDAQGPVIANLPPQNNPADLGDSHAGVVKPFRFRTYRYVITADIEKMYRQILIDLVDTDYQRILWRDHPNEELKTYRLTTLTYGTKPASFIATRCLVELAVRNQNVNPLASSIIKRDFYMDDLLTGPDTIAELSAICEDVSTILQGGGFNLRKSTSNAKSKWRNPDTTPAVGSLVLIADDDLPPLRWNLARITELHFGNDGLPRVASLKTKNGAT